LIHEVAMKPARSGTSLLLCVLLAACGDASSPGGEGAPTEAATSTLPAPAEILAALPPEARPYGLDVYTARCVICHGDQGQGIGQAPTLRALTRATIQQKLQDYRSGKTLGAQTAVMAQAVAKLSDAEIAAVSIYAGE
jgi:cytochrome c553